MCQGPLNLLSLLRYRGEDGPRGKGPSGWTPVRSQGPSRLAALQGWLDQEDGGLQGYGTADEEDEEYIERADRFESQYNHRFEAQALP